MSSRRPRDDDRRAPLDLIEVDHILGVPLMYERVAIPRRLEVDGDFGTKTSEALDVALTRLELARDIANADVWRRFLRRSARMGFMLPE